MSFSKVLIANRGEIAVRIIRACRELGLQTVAVYSDVDRKALHVRYADEAYSIGASPSSESYLNAEKILQVAKESNSEAIHPGYGFLAERTDFAQACIDEGFVFIGPKPSSISAMGDKAAARTTVSSADVPVIPGTEGHGNLRDNALITLAPSIGFPLLIKPTAGGGGKGMREVHHIEDMPGLLESARREAEASFGDGNVYLEKLLVNARHLECQILADQHGNITHLGERECSLQRRHQKLIEESPSPFIGDDNEFRKEMGEVAVKAAKSVNYINAGTIEFLVDNLRNYYFLEMNTRLQVEHPVTESVTGIDIVKEQINISQGHELAFHQDEIQFNGWAIECRINAEDPYNDFFPSTGFIAHHTVPTGPGVRVDTGVYDGFQISPYYDSLISKLIVWSEDRSKAINRMKHALDEYDIVGVTTNIPFHQHLLNQERFINGDFNVRFIEDFFSMPIGEESDQSRSIAAAILATLLFYQKTEESTQSYLQTKNPSSNWKWHGRV
jgi:acetyl-CoA carboxylase biotin carboxylase subunit